MNKVVSAFVLCVLLTSPAYGTRAVSVTTVTSKATESMLSAQARLRAELSLGEKLRMAIRPKKTSKMVAIVANELILNVFHGLEGVSDANSQFIEDNLLHLRQTLSRRDKNLAKKITDIVSHEFSRQVDKDLLEAVQGFAEADIRKAQTVPSLAAIVEKMIPSQGFAPTSREYRNNDDELIIGLWRRLSVVKYKQSN